MENNDKILNPATNRYVKKNSPLGKKILAGNIPAEKECPPDKILNPRTKRCVNRNGPIGKAILNYPTAESEVEFQKYVNIVPNATRPIQAAIKRLGAQKEFKELKEKSNASNTIKQAIKGVISKKKLNELKAIKEQAIKKEASKKIISEAIKGTKARKILKKEKMKKEKELAPLKKELMKSEFYDAPEYSKQEENKAVILQQAIKGKLSRKKAQRAKQIKQDMELAPLKKQLFEPVNTPEYTKGRNKLKQNANKLSELKKELFKSEFYDAPEYTKQEKLINEISKITKPTYDPFNIPTTIPRTIPIKRKKSQKM